MYKIYVDNNGWKYVCPVNTIEEVVDILDELDIEHYIVIRDEGKGDDYVLEQELERVRLERGKVLKYGRRH